MSNALFDISITVPAVPTSTDWVVHLRWLVAVMDDTDKSLPFIASCLAWVLKTGHLTDKQASSCNTVLTRVHAQYLTNGLDAQADQGSPDRVHDLAILPATGSC